MLARLIREPDMLETVRAILFQTFPERSCAAGFSRLCLITPFI